MKRVTVVGLVLTAGAAIAAAAAWRVHREGTAVSGPAAAREGVARSADPPGPAASRAVSPGQDPASAPAATGSPAAAAAASVAPEQASAGSGADELAAAAARALPWLRNFAAIAVSTEESAGVVERMARWRTPDVDCSAAAYGGLAIAADVAAAPGIETVLASYTQGVLVLDAGGRVIASAPPPGCQGSADDLAAIAVGDAQLGAPVIALAATGGGHRESSTWLGLYRVVNGAVAPIFAGVVESRVGDRTRTGDVTLLPGALLYRAPSGEQTLWLYRPEQQRYVQEVRVLPPSA